MNGRHIVSTSITPSGTSGQPVSRSNIIFPKELK